MPFYFFDTSALVKCYVEEDGTDWVREILDDQENSIHVSNLAKVEIIAALTRRHRGGDLTQQELNQAYDDTRHDFENQFLSVEVSSAIIEEGAALAQRYGLRAFDAVQLATALEVRHVLVQNEPDPLIFAMISADQELNAAAPLEGLVVEDPNNH